MRYGGAELKRRRLTKSGLMTSEWWMSGVLRLLLSPGDG
jgi:hypothetical protein